MIYVVWFEGDNEGEFEWFSVLPTRREAMKRARSYSVEKRIVYLKFGSDKGIEDFDATKTIVIEQKKSHYHGA
jgi:hypothetical protein